jgi:hypothetical protein
MGEREPSNDTSTAVRDHGIASSYRCRECRSTDHTGTEGSRDKASCALGVPTGSEHRGPYAADRAGCDEPAFVLQRLRRSTRLSHGEQAPPSLIASSITRRLKAPALLLTTTPNRSRGRSRHAGIRSRRMRIPTTPARVSTTSWLSEAAGIGELQRLMGFDLAIITVVPDSDHSFLPCGGCGL